MPESKKISLALFASGNGTNAEAILKHFQKHDQVAVAMVLSNNPKALALERARKFNVQVRSFNRAQFHENLPAGQAGLPTGQAGLHTGQAGLPTGQHSNEVLTWLKDAGITHLVLAGFLWLVPESLIKAYPGRIINIHPALLPGYGGQGMYGRKVHEAVRNSGDKQTGITIHLVNEKFDEGKILFQMRCDIDPDDTPDTIASKVHVLEYRYYPSEIEKWCLVS